MADLNKFEKMLELLVNEDKEAAQELFHEIVVEKSRDIYESLLEDDEEVDESDDEEVDESDEDLDEADDEEVDESDEDLDENFSLDTFEVEADDEEADDASDEEADDMDMGDEEGEEDEGDDGDVEDRVEDLEDALDDLKAEFEKMMAGDDEGEEGDDDMGGDATDDMMGDLGMDTEEAAEEDESFQATITPLESKAAMSAGEQMREYVEKVSATMGDNGSDTKSTVAGKNDMGGTTANLRGGESKGEGTQGGLAAPTAKDMNTKNVNVPGAKGATKMASQPGHGAEKKGKPETADKSASSMLNGAPKRAK
jgi:hypothetical protein